MSDADLDYVCFCDELTEILEMYPVEGEFSFFLSKREQDEIETRLNKHPEYVRITSYNVCYTKLLRGYGNSDMVDFIGHANSELLEEYESRSNF